jgi:2-polyprenyl-3-methyl-5-hydroxy-6-metoxy-1,4-benzoquinol methylase
MARAWDSATFDAAYVKHFCEEEYPFGTPEYYARYRSRYKMLLERFAQLASVAPVDVLDIGGGQLALLCHKLWNDRATVADLPGEPQLDYLHRKGITAIAWNLCSSDQPCLAKFDFIFFSEVIEHLPIPGYVVLDRLRRALKPGGILVCSTPNFYRLKNIVHLALGLPILDHMQLPGDSSLGHVIEYSRDGLQWQLEKAGFQNCHVEYRQMHHSPTKLWFRLLSWVGYPLFLVPRFRDNLLATASAP